MTQGTRTGVPRSRTCALTVFVVFNLGILGDNLPINTQDYSTYTSSAARGGAGSFKKVIYI